MADDVRTECEKTDDNWKTGQTKEDAMGKLTWYLRQLLPLTYRTTYTHDGERHFCVWRMWLGRSFDIDDVVIEGADRG